MAYTSTPLDGSGTPLPMSSAVPDGTNTPLAIRGGPAVSTGGNSNTAVALYQYDGDGVTFGAKADASATSDSGTFTFMAFVKRLLGKLLVGQQTMAASLAVTLASDQGPLTCSTVARTSVAAAVSDTSLLAANTGRKGAFFYNDSTAILYLSFGAGAASTTAYTVQVPSQGFFELPTSPMFTGAIRGIWSAAAGSVRITELT